MTICQQPSQTTIATTSHWDGEKYSKYSEQQLLVARMLLAQYAFKDTDSILDIGCGDGKITKELACKVPNGQVLGVDPSESMIDFAKRTYQGANVSFGLNMASTIAFESVFDVITAFSCLHWEPRQKEALLCFKKALKPGGAIVLAIPGPDLALRKALREVGSTPTWAPFFTGYQSPGRVWTANEYATLLVETGFVIQKIEVVSREYVPENEAKFTGLLKGMLPHLSKLPEYMHDTFVTEVTEAIKAQGRFDAQGRLTFNVSVLEIIAHSPTTL